MPAVRLVICVLLLLASQSLTPDLPATLADGPIWGESVRVATGAIYPAAALDGQEQVHLVWVDLADGSLRHTIVGGNRTAVRIDSPSRSNYCPSLAADSLGRVHAVWDGSWEGGYDVFYSCWDGGAWSKPVALPRLGHVPGEAQITTDEWGQPHVIYWSSMQGGGAGSGYAPCYTALAAGKWTAPQLLPDFVPSSAQFSFLVREGSIHLAFLYERAGGIGSVGYTRSRDSGGTWSALEDAAGDRAPVWSSSRPYVVLQEGLPVITWASQDPQTQQLCSWYTRRLPDRWQAPMRLVQSAAGQRDPVAVWDGDRLLVAWQEMVESFVGQIAVTSTDPSTGSSAPPTVFGWRGLPTMLTADVAADGAAVVAWLTCWREVYYAYRPPFRPSSKVTPLPGLTMSPTFEVRWSGTARSGAAIKWYDVQVRDGEGPWTDWLLHTTATSGYYTGVNGHTYRFRSRAVDSFGQSESWPQTCDAITTVLLAGSQLYLPVAIR